MEEDVDNNRLMESSQQSDTNDEIPIKEESETKNQKPASITVKKIRPPRTDSEIRRAKRIKMYITFFIFLLMSLLCLFVEHNFFLEKFENVLKNKTTTLFIFIISIVGALGLSTFICYCECLIKIHFFGIFFLIILFALNNYSIIYLKHVYFDFPPFFGALMTLVGGSIGLLLINIIVKDVIVNIFVLFTANAFFSIILGFLAYMFHKDFWSISFSVGAFLISEFNIYSSQYKFIIYNEEPTKKRVKKESLIYLQPFELNISVFKFFVFLISIIIKLFKFCIKCCSKKKEAINKTQEE